MEIERKFLLKELPKNLDTIERKAFYRSQISYLELPDTLKNISNNAQLLYAFDSNILNIFQKYQEIELINIGYNPFEQLKDIDFSQIQNKNKLEISIGHCQNCSLDKYLECSKSEQKNIYNFSKLSLFTNCQNECKNFNYYNDIKPYLKQGIKHFKIISKPNNLTEFNINIIRSFVKPEYQGECINEYLQRISK